MSRIAVGRLSDGRLEFWSTTAQGGLFTSWKLTTDPNADWSGWTDFLAEVGALPGAVTAVAVAPHPDGRLELWAATAQGRLFSTWKLTTDPNADWAPWFDFLAYRGGLPAGVQQVAMAPLPDGRLEAWAVTANGGLFSTWKLTTDPNADWAPWFDFLAYRKGLPAGVQQVAMAPLPDGRLEGWAVTANGGLFSTWKLDTDPNADWASWSDFLSEVGPLPRAITDVAVAPLSDRRLELWASVAQGGIFTTWKLTTDPNADWADWSDFLAEVLATIDSTFTGTVSFSTADTRFPGPFLSPLTLTAVFVANGTVRLGPFPTIVVGPFPTPVGNNTITITMVGGGIGTFNKALGNLSMPITLRFDHSLAFAGDSDVTFGLTTASSTSPSGAFALAGLPLNSTTGLIALVGASRFRGGFLGGIDCSVTVTGTFAPIP
ncbi:MAG: hypothetical protein KF778_09835 [Rhodocyclaceae bacterium]|nr:hypothetical protein [Rhodocyclaceae bacterium]